MARLCLGNGDMHGGLEDLQKAPTWSSREPRCGCNSPVNLCSVSLSHISGPGKGATGEEQ